MKQIYCSIIFAITTLTCEAVNVNGISYDLDTASKTAKVVDLGNDYEGHPSYVGDIVIPESFDITTTDREGNKHTTTYIVTAIGNGAFRANTELTSIVIPNTVTIIEYDAFDGCAELTSVTIGNSVEIIQSGAFESCTSLSSVILPNSVTKIGDGAFANLVNLKTLSIGSGVKILGDYVFVDCEMLENIYCYAMEVPSAGVDIFLRTNNATIYVPKAVVEAYQAKTPWNSFSIKPLDEADGIAPLLISPITIPRKHMNNGHIIIENNTCKFNINGVRI